MMESNTFSLSPSQYKVAMYMLRNGCITVVGAAQHYISASLGKRISEMRKMGITINSRVVKHVSAEGNDMSYYVYYFDKPGELTFIKR